MVVPGCDQGGTQHGVVVLFSLTVAAQLLRALRAVDFAGAERLRYRRGRSARVRNDICCQDTRRKISAGTRSDLGRDTILGLDKAYAKPGVGFWDFLGNRLNV